MFGPIEPVRHVRFVEADSPVPVDDMVVFQGEPLNEADTPFHDGAGARETLTLNVMLLVAYPLFAVIVNDEAYVDDTLFAEIEIDCPPEPVFSVPFHAM